MTDRQNTVVATTLVALVLVVVYLCPWRVAATGEIQWSPIYQPPITYVRSYDPARGARGGHRFEQPEASIAPVWLVGQVLAVGAAGGALYFVVSAAGREDEDDQRRRSL